MFRGQHSTVPPTRAFNAVQLYQGLGLGLEVCGLGRGLEIMS